LEGWKAAAHDVGLDPQVDVINLWMDSKDFSWKVEDQSAEGALTRATNATTLPSD
jgi:hypothetical protein